MRNDYVHAIAALKEKINDLESRINNGVRVYVDTTNTGCPIRVFIGSNNTNATLILDEQGGE